MTQVDIFQIGTTSTKTITKPTVVDELDYATGDVIGQQTIPAGEHTFLCELHPFTEKLCLLWQDLPTGVFAPIPLEEIS